jgi:hypothetical protein
MSVRQHTYEEKPGKAANVLVSSLRNLCVLCVSAVKIKPPLKGPQSLTQKSISDLQPGQ